MGYEEEVTAAIDEVDQVRVAGGERKLTPGQRKWVRRQQAVMGLEFVPSRRADLPGTILDLVRETEDAFAGSPRPRPRSRPEHPRRSSSGTSLPPQIFDLYDEYRAKQPAWSAVARAEVFANLEPLRDDVRAHLSLSRSLPLSEIKPFVLGQAAREDATGEGTWLAVPTEFRDGVLHSESIAVHYGTDVEEDGEAQPLAYLAEDAHYIAECTGCEATEAVAFLLSDWLPDVPWINIDFEATIPTLVLRVAVPRVLPKDVSRAYAALAPAVFGRGARKKAHSLQRLHHLLTFVAERFPDGPVKNWTGLHAEFERLYPGDYKDGESMQATLSKNRALLKYIAADLLCARDREASNKGA